MARTSQLLYPQREPAPLRPAATVLLMRDGPQGLELLMTRRAMTASFAPGAYVFPGGGIDAADAAPATHSLAHRRPSQSDLHLTQAIAAIRESFEELGVLLARHADGRWAGEDDIAALDRQAPFAAQCQARGLRAVLVITGQGRLGGGIIRASFAEWMQSPALRGVVSGFTSAHRRHGGDGAFYVTLKRRD